MESLELVLSGAILARLTHTFSTCGKSARMDKNIRFISMCRWMRLGEGVLISLVATDSASQLSQVATEVRVLRDNVSPTVGVISPLKQDILVEPGEIIEFLHGFRYEWYRPTENWSGGGCMVSSSTKHRMLTASARGPFVDQQLRCVPAALVLIITTP